MDAVFAQLTPYQRKAWYWLDSKVMNGTSRATTVSYSEISNFIGCDRTVAVKTMKALQEHGMIKKAYRIADSGKYGSNEYLIMPSNPRKMGLVLSIAQTIKHDPFDTLMYIARAHDLYVTMGADAVSEMTMGEWGRLIGYEDDPKVAKDWCGRFLDACNHFGVDLSVGMAHW